MESDWACCWVLVHGDVDAASSGRLEEAIAEALGARSRKVQILLNRVTSVDAAGARAVALCVNTARKDAPKVLVRGAPPNVRRMLGENDVRGRLALRIAQGVRSKRRPLGPAVAIPPGSAGTRPAI